MQKVTWDIKTQVDKSELKDVKLLGAISKHIKLFLFLCLKL
jgi:hypothetical protein